MHWEVLAAIDFFIVEVATWHVLVTYYVLVVMELSTRRVEIAGIMPHPNAAVMQQCARQLTVFMGEASLRYAVRCYLNHDHAERNHQGLRNELITPESEVGQTTGRVKRREHLGGLLSYYHREAASRPYSW